MFFHLKRFPLATGEYFSLGVYTVFALIKVVRNVQSNISLSLNKILTRDVVKERRLYNGILEKRNRKMFFLSVRHD